MKYVFDTSAYSQLLRGDERVAAITKEADAIFMPSFVVAELKYGFRLGGRQEDNDQLLTRFLASKKVQTLLPDNATTDYFVSVALVARKKGIQLSSHDVWIAALSEEWGATLVTFDRDFEHLGYEGLSLRFLQ